MPSFITWQIWVHYVPRVVFTVYKYEYQQFKSHSTCTHTVHYPYPVTGYYPIFQFIQLTSLDISKLFKYIQYISIVSNTIQIVQNIIFKCLTIQNILIKNRFEESKKKINSAKSANQQIQ